MSRNHDPDGVLTVARVSICRICLTWGVLNLGGRHLQVPLMDLVEQHGHRVSLRATMTVRNAEDILPVRIVRVF